MKLGIMQPYFVPYIGYWQLLNAVDKYVIYDDVNFIKGGWINRNKIIINGEAKYINIKMSGASSNKLINEVGVVYDKIYNKKLLKTIEMSYSKAPYFNDVFPVLKDIICNDEMNLAKHITYSIKRISTYLNINTELILSSSIEKNNDLKGQDKVLGICEVMGADEYYNPIGGKELYSHDDFKEKGIELSFIKTKEVEYEQFNDLFIPNLSIVDVMMFNSLEDIKKMLDEYQLIS